MLRARRLAGPAARGTSVSSRRRLGAPLISAATPGASGDDPNVPIFFRAPGRHARATPMDVDGIVRRLLAAPLAERTEYLDALPADPRLVIALAKKAHSDVDPAARALLIYAYEGTLLRLHALRAHPERGAISVEADGTLKDVARAIARRSEEHT